MAERDGASSPVVFAPLRCYAIVAAEPTAASKATMQAGLTVTLGVCLIVIAVVDLAWSTLSTSGAGFVSRRLAAALWRVALAIHRRLDAHRLLEAAAPAVVLAVVALWVGLLWSGWTLIFSAAPGAVIDATTHTPAGLVDRVYFVGFTLFTLGVGDFVGGAPGWRVLTALASINGLFAVTLAITYLLPIVSAATAKRQLALLIHALGDSAARIVADGWNGHDFAGLEDQLREVPSLLLLHGERHLAYPVLHYFHASEPDAALSLRLVALDDATLILSQCVDEAARPDPAVLRALQHALDVFLRRVRHRFVAQADRPPKPPALDLVRQAGVPVRDAAACRRVFAAQEERRRWLLGFILSDGWSELDLVSNRSAPSARSRGGEGS